MDFLDRNDEMARLGRLARGAGGGFAAVWGRRRIGKSALLKEWCGRYGGLYMVADQSLPPMQREAFAIALATRFPGFADVRYPTWQALFGTLSRRAADAGWHGPLALDEFPYWVEADPSLPSVLQNWIDGEKSRGGITTAIAGSVQHMMQGLVLEAGSPLYGRVDEKLKLEPLGVEFMPEGLGLAHAADAVMAYAVWGGVPRYWVAAERFGADLDRAVDALALDPLGVFHDEPVALLQSEMPGAMGLKPYLDAIGGGANRISEIAGRLGLQATALSRPLSRLVEIGLVRREIPFGTSEKSTKRSLYKVGDPFCRFWFRVLAARRSVFDSAPARVRLSVWRQLRDGLFAECWEELARGSVTDSPRLAVLLEKGDYWRPASRWWRGTEPEWDVVSSNGAGDRLLLGEVKWSARPFSARQIARLAGELGARPPPPELSGKMKRVLFVPSLEKDCNGVSSVDGVEIATAEEIVYKQEREK